MKVPIDAQPKEIEEAPKKKVYIEVAGHPHSNDNWGDPVRIVHAGGSYKKSLQVSGVICGCGLAQIKGVVDFSASELKEMVPAIIEYCKNSPKYFTSGSSGMGAVIATLGSVYYASHHGALIGAGFKQVSEYYNWAHKGLNHTQRLYILEIE